MKKKMIIEGDEKVVNVILRENKYRVSRGLVKFTEVKEKSKKKIDKETFGTETTNDSKD